MSVLLSERDLRVVLPMRDLIDAMEAALVRFSSGEVAQPLRSVLELGSQKAFFGVMPACIADPPALGAKVVTVFPGNSAAGLPTHLATIILLDAATGALLAILDGRFITEARTAAVSAVSVNLLARKSASTLALVGSGVQARSHLEAIALVRELSAVRVWSPTAAHCAAFVRDMQSRTSVPIIAAGSAQDAVAGADLIVLVTSSRDFVIRNEWIQAGAHVCAVGACRPDQREMETALVKRSRLFVDSRSGALAEAGDIVMPMNEGAFDETHIAGELGEVASGAIAGRRSETEITIFKSLGMAVEDVAAAHLAYGKAVERGLGRGFVL